MVQPLVSVVVPVYNVEQYLSRCIYSLLNQTLQEIEIILVDDGSPDRCGAICDMFSEQYPHIITIHQENGGLPSARNTGIQVARGEYLGFVDSDDWVCETMFEELYQSAKRANADLAFCDYLMVSSSCTVIPALNKSVHNVGEMLLQGIKPIACNKLFRRSCGLHFYEELKFAEDRPTTISFLTKCRRTAYVARPLYYYFQRSDSIADGYAKNVCVPYDIQSMRLLLQDCNPQYQKQAVKYCMDTIAWSVEKRPSSKADMIEYLQELAPMMPQNRYLKGIKAIHSLLNRETVPKRLICLQEETEGLSDAQHICRESWKRYGAGMDLVELDLNNCGIEEAPGCVRQAYAHGDYQFVGDYFRLKFVYDHGGVAIDSLVRLNLPIGELRAERSFFGYKNAKEINGHIFGSVAHAKVLRDILDTYELDSILNDRSDWTLSERIQSILKQFGMDEKGEGMTQTLSDDVKLYGCERLSYRIDPKQNVAQLFDELSLAAEQRGFSLLESDIPANHFSGASGIKADRKKDMQYQISRLQMEVDRLKNSRSWKIMRPFRRLFNFFRKAKYSEAEIR